MQESFLHFVWQYQYFNRPNLRTDNGLGLQVLHPGIHNHHAGPDFLEARILIDGMEWRGAVEIHVLASQWYEHGHQWDAAYQQVILHVVWKSNRRVADKEGRVIPTLEICDKLNPKLFLRHRRLFANTIPIPCHHQLTEKHHALLQEMLPTALAPRLKTKCQQVLQLLESENHHWDAVLYRVLGRNFGFKINTDSFEQLVKLVPLQLVKRIWNRPLQLEALYFGQAGFLQVEMNDRYYQLLKKEYAYLRHLCPDLGAPMNKARWKFLRLRPANFPSLRIAQFSQLMHQQGYQFGAIREAHGWEEIKTLLQVKCSDYWQLHYQFGKKGGKTPAHMGRESMINLVINSVIPMKMAYQKSLGKDYLQFAQEYLKSLPAENNRIIRYWKDKGFKVNSAYCSQALLALYDQFCLQKRCMHCSIGTSLIRG